MDSSFIFKKLFYKKEIFLDTYYEQCLQMIEKFNNKFRYLHLYEEIDFNLDRDIFFVEIDTTKMDDKVYKDLLGNFYPCFSHPTDLDLVYDKDNLLELLKLPMVNEKGFVLILSTDVLLNDRYYLPIIKKLHYSKKLNKDKIEAVKEIANSLGVEIKKYD